MAIVALSTVGYQKDDKDPDSVVWFEPDDEIKGAPEDVVAQWVANGSVGEPAPIAANVMEEKDALEARVAELEALLEEAKKPATAPAATPAKAAPAKATP